MNVISQPGDGRGFEREVVGHSLIDVDPQLRKERVRDLWEGRERVKCFQDILNWNPRYPKTPLAQGLFEAVTSGLRGRGKGKLYMFDSVGTMIDVRWGVDCWFECGNRFVTIDLTVSKKKDYFKADFLVTRNHFLLNKHFGIGRAIARRLCQ